MSIATRYATLFAKMVTVVCLLGVGNRAFGQAGTLAHFVAPVYPPLARQAMISGQVIFRLSVAPDGKILDVKEEASPHPLLTQEAKAALRQWEFQHWPRAHPVSVTIHFGFSGSTRESNPATVIKADFAAPTVRVYVTTDGVPTVRP